MTQEYDEKIIADSIAALIAGIGEDASRPGLRGTPERVARAWREWTRGYQEFRGNLSVFPTDYKGIVVRRAIPFSSLCEHHLAYYGGTIDFAYVPDGQVVGISKIIRFMQHYSARLTIQEDLTTDLVTRFEKVLKPLGCAIRISGFHSCESSRGINTSGVPTITTIMTGKFLTDQNLAKQFYEAVR